MNNKYQKALSKVETMLQDMAAQRTAAAEKLSRLNETAEQIRAQKEEALSAGNQKLYNAADFAEKQNEKEMAEANSILQKLDCEPALTAEESKQLVKDLISGADQMIRETDIKFISLIDEIIPEIETAEAIRKKTNDLIKSIKVNLEKDPRIIEQYERAGVIDAPGNAADFKAFAIASKLKETELYKQYGKQQHEMKTFRD